MRPMLGLIISILGIGFCQLFTKNSNIFLGLTLLLFTSVLSGYKDCGKVDCMVLGPPQHAFCVYNNCHNLKNRGIGNLVRGYMCALLCTRVFLFRLFQIIYFNYYVIYNIVIKYFI